MYYWADEIHKRYLISTLMEDSKVYEKYAKQIGIKLNNDSPIFREIEGFIIEKIDEMFKEDVANGKYERSHYERTDDGILLKDLDI